MIEPYYQDKMVTIYHGDCAEIVPELGSVDSVVTSPPYDGLREYNGYSFDFGPIARALSSRLVDGGVLAWVVADETSDFKESTTSMRQALFFVDECGLGLLDTMVYEKNTGPTPYPNMMRYAPRWEYMFVLSKGRPQYFDPIKKPTLNAGKAWSATERQKDGSLKPVAGIGADEKICSNVWRYAVGSFTGFGDHPAPFPIDLAKGLIKSWTPPGGVVLDPFMGSGTTLAAARELGRKSIGIDISEKYCEIAAQRVSQMSLFEA